jgi:hypothetical protein
LGNLGNHPVVDNLLLFVHHLVMGILRHMVEALEILLKMYLKHQEQ